MSLLGYKIYLVSFPSFDIPREFEGKFGYNGFYCQVYWYPTTPHGQPRLKKDKWLRIDQAGKSRQPSRSHPAKFTPVYDRVLKPSIGTGTLPLQQRVQTCWSIFQLGGLILQGQDPSERKKTARDEFYLCWPLLLMIKNITEVVLMQTQNIQNRTAGKRRFNIRLGSHLQPISTRLDVFILSETLHQPREWWKLYPLHVNLSLPNVFFLTSIRTSNKNYKCFKLLLDIFHIRG